VNELTKVKLGKRLSALEASIGNGYDHIWDCCCDHGLLGFQLLEQSKAKQVHFVDIVPQLLTEIEAKLTRFYRGETLWQVHCLDVAQLPLLPYQQDKHLIIIAGVGGLLMIELLTKLLSITSGLNVEFILSPVHHNCALRAFLKTQSCALLDEFIVAENRRFYEVIQMKQGLGDEVSLVGEKMWDLKDPEHQDYLAQTISHYQRMAKNPQLDVKEIIEAYDALNHLPK